MSGYIGTKSVTLSTTSASVGGDSSVGGDLTVDTNTLYVDSTNNRVGIGTVSPDYPLHVNNSSQNSHVYLSGGGGLGESYGGFIRGYGVTNEGGHLELGVVDANTKRVAIEVTQQGNEIIFDTAGSERMRIDSSGNLLVATTSNPSTSATSQAFRIGPVSTGVQMILSGSETSSYAKVSFNNGNGQVGFISTSGSSTSYSTSSDHRLKENVTDVTDGITRVKQLEPKRFNFIADPDTTVDGFLAHEAQTVVPEAVTGTHNEVDDDGNAVMQGIDQSKLVPLLTAALKESIAKIEALEARVTALEGN